MINCREGYGKQKVVNSLLITKLDMLFNETDQIILVSLQYVLGVLYILSVQV